MPSTIALFRAVNVGGTSKVSMAELCRVGESVGLRNVRSLLQTGNLVFESDEADEAALGARLQAACRDQLGLETEILLRSAAEWSAAIAANPFPAEAADDPSHFVLIALMAEPSEGAVEALRAAIVGRERLAVTNRTLYAVYPDGIGRSKLILPLIEKKLGTRGTGRNWNTVLKLEAMARGEKR